MPDIQSIKESIGIKQLIKDSFIQNATFNKIPGGYECYAGGFSVAFPCSINGEKWAFRCWHAEIGNVSERYKNFSKDLKNANLPYFCDFTYSEMGICVDGKLFPSTRMKWVEGENLKNYICKHKNEKSKLKELSESFMTMFKDMHRHKFAHGDLQHENIIINSKGEIFLIDYDSISTPSILGFSDYITGKSGYQHPCRIRNKTISEKLDYFSELIIYTTILAISDYPELVTEYNLEDDDTTLFSKKDFDDIRSAKIYQELLKKGGIFEMLMNILEEYLSHKDINELQSFDSMLTNDSIIRFSKEESLWKSANSFYASGMVSINDEDKYRKYLREYPDGKYADQAKTAIKQIEKRREEINKQAEATAAQIRKEKLARTLKGWAWLSVVTALSVILIYRLFTGHLGIFDDINIVLTLSIWGITPFCPAFDDGAPLRDSFAGINLITHLSDGLGKFDTFFWYFMIPAGYLVFLICGSSLAGLISIFIITIGVFFIVSFLILAILTLIDCVYSIRMHVDILEGISLIVCSLCLVLYVWPFMKDKEYKYIFSENKDRIGLIYKDGVKYEGELMPSLLEFFGVPDGKGTLIYPDGNVETGVWKNGKKVAEIIPQPDSAPR